MGAVKILVTTDGSNLSDKAVETAIELARQFDGTVIGMTAVLSPPLLLASLRKISRLRIVWK